MKPQPPADPLAFGWKRSRSRHGIEVFHYPSDLARQLLLYPAAIGHARTPPGDTSDHVVQDRYLLHYVVRGELWHHIGEATQVARAGEACLMDLSLHTVHGAGGSQPAASYWCSFNGKDMARYFAELRADRDPVFTGLNRATMSRLFAELMRLTERNDIGYEFRVAGLLTLVLAELYSVRAKEHPMISLGVDARAYSAPVREGIDWIVRHYEQPCLLKQLCDAVGYSRSQLTRLFRRETGCSPVVWLNRYRIEQSKRLLTMTDKPVAEIAQVVGIPDQNYFARLFRSVAGQTPREFRQDASANQ